MDMDDGAHMWNKINWKCLAHLVGSFAFELYDLKIQMPYG